MKKLIRKICYLSSLSILLAGCTSDFADTNTNPLDLTQDALPGNNLLQGQVFAQAQYVSVNGLHWRFQISQNLFSDIWCQYFATTASGFDSDRYVQVGRWADLAWGSFYGQAAPQIKLVEDLSEADGNDVGNALAKIWRVHAYHRITDYWGPVPYSAFGNGELSVPYDSQESMYNDFFVTLDDAVAKLQANAGGSSYTSGDRIYGGSAAQWLKFANSLRLRLAMRIRFADPGRAQAEAEKAINAGVITDNADNAFVSVDDTNRNPLETITDWGEFRMSATMESILKGYDDPRMPEYFAPAVDGDSDGDGIPYEGLLNGQTRVSLETSKNAGHSDLATKFIDVAKGGENPPYEIMNAAEMFFLRAEGALAGWSMGGTAQSLYEDGIRASMTQKTGADGAAIDAYITSANVPVLYDAGTTPVTDIPIAFDAGGGAERQLEQIITQKWIAIYPNGWEAWAELRRTGYPKQYARVESQNPDVGVDEIMRRMVYVQSEFDTNGDAVSAAIALPEMSGGDKNNTKVWWDKK
ncbi:SusD/RagB family nutrient-binding outer membrane lipoprotein [Flagellimonas sp. S3867]|uniref:SusD/RagB family nutrient-binding outer membrane lipoprotein n=1 Tax=Flagellimonas sp. S3867 TaxID=2768063 RepID=UPI001689122F|nr:SusD/RagB family nutrient-binding outer membrane lipoprotein [Flagellimonas sp. S3867]